MGTMFNKSAITQGILIGGMFVIIWQLAVINKNIKNIEHLTLQAAGHAMQASERAGWISGEIEKISENTKTTVHALDGINRNIVRQGL